MSLYNLIFGQNPFSGLLLEVIGTTRDAVPRYRDCYLNEAGDRIIIHTRTGGGNRGHYDSLARHKNECTYDDCVHEGPFNEDLRVLPGFLYDADDDFDCTYADFHFEVPEPFREQVKLLREIGASEAPAGERWQAMLEGLRGRKTDDPRVARALEIGERIAAQLEARSRPDGR